MNLNDIIANSSFFVKVFNSILRTSVRASPNTGAVHPDGGPGTHAHTLLYAAPWALAVSRLTSGIWAWPILHSCEGKPVAGFVGRCVVFSGRGVVCVRGSGQWHAGLLGARSAVFTFWSGQAVVDTARGSVMAIGTHAVLAPVNVVRTIPARLFLRVSCVVRDLGGGGILLTILRLREVLCVVLVSRLQLSWVARQSWALASGGGRVAGVVTGEVIIVVIISCSRQIPSGYGSETKVFIVWAIPNPGPVPGILVMVPVPGGPPCPRPGSSPTSPAPTLGQSVTLGLVMMTTVTRLNPARLSEQRSLGEGICGYGAQKDQRKRKDCLKNNINIPNESWISRAKLIMGCENSELTWAFMLSRELLKHLWEFCWSRDCFILGSLSSSPSVWLGNTPWDLGHLRTDTRGIFGDYILQLARIKGDIRTDDPSSSITQLSFDW